MLPVTQIDTFYNGLTLRHRDTINAAAGGTFMKMRPEECYDLIENMTAHHNDWDTSAQRNESSSSITSFNPEIAALKLQMEEMNRNLTKMLQTNQQVNTVTSSCETCGGPHSYNDCPATVGHTQNVYAVGAYNQGGNSYQSQAPNTPPPVAFPQEITNYIRTNENKINSMQTQMNNLATSNQRLESMLGNFIKMNTASSSGTGSLPSNTVANPKGELKAITTRSGLVLDEPSVPMPPPFINPEEDERVEETFTDPEHGEFTIKVPPPLVQKAKQRNFVIHQRDPRHPNIPYPSRMNQEKQKEKDDVQIHKFWQMFKQLHINITLADALILIPKYQKMLKSLLSNKEKLIELANTPVSENCSAVILKKLPEKLGDPGKFLIPCGFSELKCKALADLGASINLMPLSVWKELGLPELISTQMTLELANRDICTPKGIARDVFVPVGKFTFPADFVIIDYESDPRVLLILGRPFLRTARALIDIYGEEMILRDGDESLILNMRNDTSRYSDATQNESINMIDVYNASSEGYLAELFSTIRQSDSPTFSHPDLTSPEVINPSSGNPAPTFDLIVSFSPTLTSLEESDLIWEEFEAYLASDSSPLRNDDPVGLLLEEFADELALITFPPGNDDLPIDIESDLREIEYLLNHDPTAEMDFIPDDLVDKNSPEDVIKEIECLLNQYPLANYSPNNDLVDTIPEMFTDEHTLDYSSPQIYDDDDDDLFDLKSDNDEWRRILYGDPFDSKEEKIKESKLLIDELNELDPPRSSDFLPSPECDSVFNPRILIHDNLFEITIRETPDKNVKKIATSNASLILEDFDPPLYELPFHKEVPGFDTLLSFSSENEEKVFKPRILTSKGVHTSLLPELSHQDPKSFKVINIVESPMEIFPCSYGGNIPNLDDFSDCEVSRALGFVLHSLELHILSFILGIRYPNLID
ncbi:reverse transcriptase domain-containing protein [Tanacetum coccineum]